MSVNDQVPMVVVDIIGGCLVPSDSTPDLNLFNMEGARKKRHVKAAVKREAVSGD